MKKQIGLVLTTIVISAASIFPALAGWITEGDEYKYQAEEGYFASGGIRNIDGYNYAFDNNGYMLRGWQYISFRWYYFDPSSGVQLFDWQQIDGKWYYLDPGNSGAIYTYWLSINNKLYYLDESGVMQTGIFYLTNETTHSEYAYEAGADGVVTRNTQLEANGVVYKYDSAGIITYRTPNTIIARKVVEGRDSWLYLLRPELREAQNEEVRNLVLYGQYQQMNDRYDKYRKNVSSKSGSTRQSALSSWESQTTTKLQEYGMDDGAITEYMTKVKNGRYVKMQLPEDPEKFNGTGYYEDGDDYDYDDYDD